MRNTNGNGTTVATEFATPVVMVFTIPVDLLPDGAEADELTVTFWNGTVWVDVHVDATEDANGNLTMAASMDHFTTFGVMYRDGYGKFSPEPAAVGVSTVAWGGGGFTCWTPDWGSAPRYGCSSTGAPWATPPVPDVRESGFLQVFPDGVPRGTLGIMLKR